MKEFINIMLKDYQKENFTKKNYVIYGIIAPLALIAAVSLANYIATL